MHDGPVFLGEVVEGAVGEWAYEVEVSDYGPWFWARGEAEGGLFPVADEGGDEEER